MFYIKILILIIIAPLMFAQGYYTAQNSNSFYQLLLNDNNTFSYSEQSPVGNVTVSVAGSYSYTSTVQISASGTDSRNNTPVQIKILLKGNQATIFIYGRERILTRR